MIDRGKSASNQLAILALAAVFAGCSTSAPRGAPDRDKVVITVADRAAYDRTIHNLRGDVVLVDFWAHWCESCIDKFPHIVELASRDWQKGLSLVTVDMDAPEAVEKTTTFLKEQRAGAATNLISQLGGGSEAMEAFEIPNG